LTSFRIVLTDGSHYDLDADLPVLLCRLDGDWYRFVLNGETIGQFSSANLIAWWKAKSKPELDDIVVKTEASVAEVVNP
jgi:hypothetical protein